jgi:hypothetical protein
MVRSAAILAIMCASATTLRAGDLQAVLIDMSYAKPVRFNAGASLFLSKQKDVKNMPADEAAGGVIVGGSVGACGLKAWGGLQALDPLGGDVRFVVTRTWDQPGTSAEATYIGGEVGWGGLGLRLSAGYGQRVAGPSTTPGHIVTWGVGLAIPRFR